LAKVRIREERIPAIGDKFCSRCGQKGTVGLVIPEKDMPFTEDGVRPDIIINPHALPSRMTIGQLVETLMGKACVNAGGYGDCTAFVNKGSKHELFGKILNQNGYNSTGNQMLYNGMTGQQLQANVFIGPTYYMRLKHMVKDKINHRARGPIEQLTHQTVGGRANDGGLRIGEMERDGVIAHGAAGFLQESMLTRGDEYYMAVCNNTGTIAIYNNTQNLFLSPMADGPIKFQETLDHTLNIENVTKYGRNFSILRIPYAFKLLIQELQTMNIQMRLITEDNIDQVTNMGYSNNIIKLKKEELSKPNLAQNDYINATLNAEVSVRTRRNINTLYKDNLDIEDSSSSNEPIEYPRENQNTNLQPEEYGWSYYSYDEERGEAYKSLIRDKNGDATEVWFVGEHDGDLPDRFPSGWNSSTLEYNDGVAIPPNVMIEELNNNQVPNNWPISLDIIKRENKGKPVPVSPPYVPVSPPYVPVSPDYPPGTTPPYAPGSPDYPPGTTPPYAPGSPDYPPGTTPPYPPGSPQYHPRSPDYPPSDNTPPTLLTGVIPVNTIVGIPVYAPNSPVYNPNSVSSSSDGTIPPPPPPETYSDSSLDSNIISIDTKPEPRDDGIELIINEKKEITKEDTENESSESSSSGEKKSISFN
jgi:hypothetical protein